MPTTLIVTNDFPPRIGGIERFVAQVCTFCDEDVVVLTSAEPGAAAHDARLPYEVVRLGRLLLPTPPLARQARALLRRSGASRVVFGAAAPLGLLAGDLRRAGAQQILALSHGHETWWAQVPGARRLLRRIGREVDVLTTISTYTAGLIGPALDPRDRHKLTRLPPPVDTTFFTPDARERDDLRSSPDPRPSLHRPSAEAGTGNRVDDRAPRCIAVGRLVRRKGVDTLLRAWPEVCRRVPGAELVLVGDGQQRRPPGRVWPVDSGSPHRSRSPVAWIRSAFGSGSGARTCSPCRCVSGWAVSTPKVWDWRRSRPRRAVYPWWSATRAALRKRSWTG